MTQRIPLHKESFIKPAPNSAKSVPTPFLKKLLNITETMVLADHLNVTKSTLSRFCKRGGRAHPDYEAHAKYLWEKYIEPPLPLEEPAQKKQKSEDPKTNPLDGPELLKTREKLIVAGATIAQQSSRIATLEEKLLEAQRDVQEERKARNAAQNQALNTKSKAREYDRLKEDYERLEAESEQLEVEISRLKSINRNNHFRIDELLRVLSAINAINPLASVSAVDTRKEAQ